MVSTNGRAAALIKYESNGIAVVRSSADAVNGEVTRRVPARTDTFRFRNYLQYEGVIGGENLITMRVRQSGDLRADSVRVLPDTAILKTSVSPYPFAVKVTPEAISGRVGDSIDIKVVLTRPRNEDVGLVSIRPIFDRAILALTNRYDLPRSARVAANGRILQPSVKLLRPGASQLVLAVSSARNNPTVIVPIAARPRSSGSTLPVVMIWAIGGLPLILVTIWFVRSRPGR
jgi:hypothetical protein